MLFKKINVFSSALLLIILSLFFKTVFAANLTNGKSFYQNNCSSCHGVSAKEIGPVAFAMAKKIPVLPELLKDQSKQSLIKMFNNTTSNGHCDFDFKEIVKNKAVDDLTMYLMTFKK